jgi:hypothetical protein
LAPKLEVCAQGPIGRWVDVKFEWVMRHVSGVPLEATQRTHRWNNHHLKEEDVAHLNAEWVVAHQGDQNARKLPRVPVLAGALAHVTKYGGWKRYLVLAPDTTHDYWHIGWRWPGGAGVSRVRAKGPVRVLVGPGPTEWFGIEADTNVQIPIIQIGDGHVGDNSEFSQVPLF